MNKLITINLSYYNQPKEIILKHINYWNSFEKNIKRKFTFFIIDDNSKIPINEVLKDVYIKYLDFIFIGIFYYMFNYFISFKNIFFYYIW